MPVFIAAMLGGLISSLSSMVGRVLVALGLGFVSYQGVDALLTVVKAEILSNLALLPPQAFQVASSLKVGVAISILISAYSVRLIFQGLTGGTIRRIISK